MRLCITKTRCTLLSKKNNGRENNLLRAQELRRYQGNALKNFWVQHQLGFHQENLYSRRCDHRSGRTLAMQLH